MENVCNRMRVEFIRKDVIDKIIKHPSYLSMKFLNRMTFMIAILLNKTKFRWINRYT